MTTAISDCLVHYSKLGDLKSDVVLYRSVKDMAMYIS